MKTNKKLEIAYLVNHKTIVDVVDFEIFHDWSDAAVNIRAAEIAQGYAKSKGSKYFPYFKVLA